MTLRTCGAKVFYREHAHDIEDFWSNKSYREHALAYLQPQFTHMAELMPLPQFSEIVED